MQGGGPSGKIWEFDTGRGKSEILGKVGEIVVCLRCATAIAVLTKTIVHMHKMGLPIVPQK